MSFNCIEYYPHELSEEQMPQTSQAVTHERKRVELCSTPILIKLTCLYTHLNNCKSSWLIRYVNHLGYRYFLQITVIS